ncbi:hypothetical protein [Burkholderia gladioli]|uniref:hypothetical protein n=1 Tax=Burkholderia gladioli TaxID=28095 RepID=UPI00163ED4C8|nr:hypothetical protein [Burkholderia gladioli]
MERTPYIATRNTPSSKTYAQPVYRDHPAAAVPLTGEFTLTADEVLYILGVARQARDLHFNEIRLMDARIHWLAYDQNPAGGFIERRTKTAYNGAGIVVTPDNFRIQGRETENGPLLFTMHIRLDDLVRDFALVPRPTDARKAA